MLFRAFMSYTAVKSTKDTKLFMKKGVFYVDWLTEIYNIGPKHENKETRDTKAITTLRYKHDINTM
jgi:hypothetical protein